MSFLKSALGTLSDNLLPTNPPATKAGNKEADALAVCSVMIPPAIIDKIAITCIKKKMSCKLARNFDGSLSHPASRAYINIAGPPVPNAEVRQPPKKPAIAFCMLMSAIMPLVIDGSI